MKNQIMSNQIKIKTGCYLELLTPETITWKYKSKISKNENGENVPDLEITEVVLIHCSVVNNKSQKIQGYCIQLFLINRSVNY